jgi:hypothetical protein
MAVPLLFVVVLLAVVISLIVVPSTRKVGWIILAVLVGMPLVLIPIAGFFWLKTSRFETANFGPPPMVNGRTVQGESWQKPNAEIPVSETVPTPQPIVPSSLEKSAASSSPANVFTPAEKQPIDKALTAESAKLIEALSKVLAKTIVEDHKTWEDLAAKITQQMPQLVEKEGTVVEATAEKQTPPSKPKPDWVGRQSWFGTADTHYERDIEVDPMPTLVESEAKLSAAYQKAIDEYVELAYTDALTKVTMPLHEVGRYEEWRHTSLGDMLTLHVLAKIDRNEIAGAYQKAQAERAELEKKANAEKRLWRFGECFAGGFLLLAAIWGYLKIDLASGGRRRGILRSATLVVILSIVAAVAIAVAA